MESDPVSYSTQRGFQIYSAGLRGERPAIPISPDALEQRARDLLPPEVYDFVAGGAGSGETIQANREAFRRWRIVPRVLCRVARRDLRMALFGTTLSAPVLLAPIGTLSIVHPDAEPAVARAAAALGVPIVLSGLSSVSLEEVAQAAPEATRWFQLYWSPNLDLTLSLAARAEKAGYSAIVVTLDAMLMGWRERDLQNGYLPSLRGVGGASHFADPVFRSLLARSPEEDRDAAVRQLAKVFSNPDLCWDDLEALRRQTRLPILLKSILHPEDAVRAVERGMDGVIVSNHGGRQIDGSIASLEALPEIVRAVDGRVPVLFDSGIRRGSDAIKALALGAQAVLLGRPYVWGLAAAGEAGVREVVLNFLADLDTTLGLCGCATCAELNPELLRRDPK
jgi:isopentenyl diphosphate isomerase/L-lactate dehydrogenase-like FMN-dependent dehydrogenase